MRLFLITIGIGLLLGGSWYYFSHVLHGKSANFPEKHSSRQNEKMSVATSVAKKGSIKVYLDELGSVTPRNTVTVRSRVEGQLMRILFQEGQLVKAGELLVELDASPFRAQLMQAEGQQKKDKALLKEAQIKLQRYQILFTQDAVARQELDTQESLVHQYEGAAQADQGQIESAKVQIGYTQITAPVSGRIGLRQVDLGNIVRAGEQNGIATITELQPITVVFSIPEDDIPAVLRRMQNKELLLVEALSREGRRRLAIGTLAAVDSQIDPATGTVKCKAQFTNKDLALFPNQFVNIRLHMEIKRDVVIIPVSAVQHGSDGSFVFVVKGDDTITIRPVQPGAAEGENISIPRGIEPGEVVVVDGMDTLREGSRVKAVRHWAENVQSRHKDDNPDKKHGDGSREADHDTKR
jgi:multidrug efflux system membrane fusion protein